MSAELRPCPFCGHPGPRLVSRTETRGRDDGLSTTVSDYIYGGHVEVYELPMRDFRHVFTVRCPRCHARGPIAATDWHARTQEEADEWSHDEKYFGFAPDSDFARPAREEAARKWNAVEEES